MHDNFDDFEIPEEPPENPPPPQTQLDSHLNTLLSSIYNEWCRWRLDNPEASCMIWVNEGDFDRLFAIGKIRRTVKKPAFLLLMKPPPFDNDYRRVGTGISVNPKFLAGDYEIEPLLNEG